jgi:outer membrane receptor for ferric coprogen and ferric-rhodotorulic acid
VFDKTYYKTVGTSNGGNWYGDPRNVLLTLRGAF